MTIDRPRTVTDADIPALPAGCNSWIVVRNDTGKPWREIYDRKWLKCLYRDKVTIWTARDWLVHFNASVRPDLPSSIL